MSELPNKRYYSVSEVCRHCDLKPYTLRYWEKKTGIVSPVRIHNRRYYTKSVFKQVIRLSELINKEGYSITQAVDILEQGLSDSSVYLSILTKIDAILSE